MPNPTAAMLVIGDEILSGRTRDANLHFLANELTEIGIDLNEVRIISDKTDAIVFAVQELSAKYQHVFTSGGIGPTHDDLTADAVALAFGRAIDVRVDAVNILQSYYAKQGLALNEARLRMARIPEGANLIDNPISSAPGFRLHNVYVMAGVPVIFKSMVANVLPSLKGGLPLVSETIRIELGEGDIADLLAQTADAFPNVLMGSYPFQKDGMYGTNLVLRSSDKTLLMRAKKQLIELISS